MVVLGYGRFLMSEVPLYAGPSRRQHRMYFEDEANTKVKRYVLAFGYHYRVTSLIRNRLSLGPYSRPMPRALRWS